MNDKYTIVEVNMKNKIKEFHEYLKAEIKEKEKYAKVGEYIPYSIIIIFEYIFEEYFK